MNGLKYIRTQCNFSLSELAERLNVSRQIISAWENNKKEIPEARKKQLADFFGIDKCFFDDITEEQKNVLLGKAMFRYMESGVETYRYKPNLEMETQMAYFIPEREKSLDEEFVELQRKQKQLLERINRIISGSEQASLRDQMSYIVRGTEVFTKVADAMEECFSKEPLLKMQYFHVILEVLQALTSSIKGTCNSGIDERFSTEGKWIGELSDLISLRVSSKIEGLQVPFKGNAPKRMEQKKSILSMEEKISKAEEEYRNFDKPDDMQMYSVNLDYIE